MINMNNTFFTFDQQSAAKAGSGVGIVETGAYIGKITSCKAFKSKAKQTSGLEFSFETEEGQKANFLQVYYQKADGEPIQGGQNIINAIMGILSIKALTYTEGKENGETVYYVPEVCNKPIGLFLQKVLYTKSNGSDAYKFEIKTPFNSQTMQTFREQIEQKQALTIGTMLKVYKDKDDRDQPQGYGQQMQNAAALHNPALTNQDNFYDNDPF